MAQQLPNINNEETVLFHKDFHLPSHWVILQIPLKGKENKSNTFKIDLQNADDRAWFRMLAEERKISNGLDLYGHVVYFPKTKEVVPVEDKEVQSMTMAQRLFTSAGQAQESQGRRAGVKLGVRRIRRSFAGGF